MWTRQELKEKGKAAFKNNYWRNVLVALILGLLSAGVGATSSTQNSQDQAQNAGSTVTHIDLTPGQAAVIGGAFLIIIIVGILLDVFVWNPLQIGCYAFFKDNVKNGNTEIAMLKEGFSDYGHKFVTMLLMSIYTVLWFCLFIVPGFIKIYSYRMVPFIVKDYPDLTANEVITKSREMMDGQKKNAFLLDLSFIGWFLLSVATFGIVGIFWASPYYQNTNAALYLRLNGEDAE